MKLLLTGFEPFLNNATNPTEMIVNELHGQIIKVIKLSVKFYR
ncbi:pyrrolidone-carboxylate peptidase [Oceanobacillus polygoni]|uniref:Pyrrolidone-carboxylate peptidase n=1 Tax=Oceanobacillus polygoni TaxID=1235259 RepID=A0A9X0YV16_9BACI|nr:hypothetical protein [Oceanobacillus polygoni]MBP2078877.1 pyrrolidone-carboxylate peptidase [Oceanobacillus polygoni]